jgi:hypothetical protein
VRHRALIALCFVGLVVTGCAGSDKPKGSKAFCLAADRYNTEIERPKIDVDRQIARVEELVRTAPKAIQGDAQVFLDALRQVRTDPSIKDDPDIKRAVDNVNRFANQACGVYDRKSGI